MILALLSIVLLTTAVEARHKACGNITIKSEGNCPSKGYICDEALPVKYRSHHNEFTCAVRGTELAVKKRIVKKVHCRKGKWRATRCQIDTKSAVCAKYCDVDACPSFVRRAPKKYAELRVSFATKTSKCATAKCKYGFVSMLRNGTVISELPATSTVTCDGDGQWTVDGTAKHAYLMCKRKPKGCPFTCDERPWTSGLFTVAPSPATKDLCQFTCPTGQALSYLNGTLPVAATSATCTAFGYLLPGKKVVPRIGCTPCDVVDGDLTSATSTVKPYSANCVVTCPKQHRLRYGVAGSMINAPGNVFYRQLKPTVADNKWITRSGYTLKTTDTVDCVARS